MCSSDSCQSGLSGSAGAVAAWRCAADREASATRVGKCRACAGEPVLLRCRPTGVSTRPTAVGRVIAHECGAACGAACRAAVALTGRVDVADHLQRLALADLFVDTPQYNGGTTGAAAPPPRRRRALVWCRTRFAHSVPNERCAKLCACEQRSQHSTSTVCEAQGSTVRRKWSARLSAALGDSLSR